MQLYHNSRSAECRAPLGAVRCGRPVRLRLFGATNVGRAILIWTVNGQRESLPMIPADDDSFEIRFRMPQTPAICEYFFYVENRDGAGAYYGNAWDGLGGVGTPSGPEPIPFQITVYDPEYQTPEYLRKGVMYQVFPDRFRRTGTPRSDRSDLLIHENWEDIPMRRVDAVKEKDNYSLDFFGGTLKGIEQKLPYLKSLGVTVLYLNPIFKSRSNHRYDTGDYEEIDPMLGTKEDFRSLCEAADRAGMHVMLDGVFSHTGADSLYFNFYGHYDTRGAYQDRRSPWAKWYFFRHWPDDYESWWGIETLPRLNKQDESLRRYFLGRNGIVSRWIREGASGWRLDVADELPMDYLRALRKAARSVRKDAVVLGEVWEDASHKVAYGEKRSYCLGDTLDSVMNYPLRGVLLDFLLYRCDAEKVCRLILSQQENYPAPFYYSLMNIMGSHDRPRILSLLSGLAWGEEDHENRSSVILPEGQLELGKKRLLAMLRVITALPGIPCVYYGDECGMQGTADPYCRGTFPWGKEDTALQEEFRSLLKLRERPVVQTGALSVYAEGPGTLVIRRYITAGHDVFGQVQEDDVFETRITRP